MEDRINKITDWIAEYVKSANKKGVVIGNSGGKDSAVVIALCAKALGKENVLAVEIPYKSSIEDLEDGNLVAKTFGVRNIKIDMQKMYDSLEKSIESVGQELNNDAKINIKPRMRMTTLYAIAQSQDYLVAGTGNLCEIFIGYTTKWGDSASDFNPIANFTVQEVLEIGGFLGVPKKILEKAPNDGLGSGADETRLGVSYKEIAEYIKTGKTNPRATKIIEDLHRKTEHKRNPIPTYKE